MWSTGPSIRDRHAIGYNSPNMSAWSRSSYSNLIGSVGLLCVALFCLALWGPPERIDALLRPYGLYVAFGLLLAAILLPSIAAITGSKRWLFVTAFGVVTLVKFFLGVTS